jgi:solute carrier family 26 (sodium-independent sulfate anion transporter), member 11
LEDNRPILRAVVLDFSSVNHLDVTSVQSLIDVRNQLDNYAAPEIVEWHFASVNNRWSRRALAVAGFGYPSVQAIEKLGKWKPIFSVASIDAADSSQATPTTTHRTSEKGDEEDQITSAPHTAFSPADGGVARVKDGSNLAAIQGMNWPFFHIDISAAVESAVLNAESKAQD